jgi:hypothetical protein
MFVLFVNIFNVKRENRRQKTKTSYVWNWLMYSVSCDPCCCKEGLWIFNRKELSSSATFAFV